MILAGDIGGTKTLLAVYEYVNKTWECVKKQQFASGDFDTFGSLLTEFLENEKIATVCLGIAGPVINGICNTTNLPWILKTNEIAQQTGTDKVFLLNDLEATAWGVLNLSPQNFVELNPKGIVKASNVAILAAGTGLGEAIVTWDGIKHHVVSTEGGHSDFAPNTQEEILLLQYLMKLYPEHVSYERLISGDGLVNIYRFLQSLSSNTVNNLIEQQMQTQDPAAVISENCINGNDAICIQALDLFCRIYGAEAGNLALKCLPYGGIILAGGIAAKILPIIQKNTFMQGFLAKGRYSEILSKISIKVCINSDAALIGAMNYAKNNFNE